MAYVPTAWVDSPSTSTPISAAALNNMEDGIAAAAQLDANLNFSANAIIPGFTTTAVVASNILTMTAASTQIQAFTGSLLLGTQNVRLPSAGVPAGAQYVILDQMNQGSLAIQSSTGAAILTITPVAFAANPAPAGVICTALVAAPTTAANWFVQPILPPGSTAPGAMNVAEWDNNLNLSAGAFLPLSTSSSSSGTTTLTISSNQVQIFTGATANGIVKLPTSSVPAGLAYTIINSGTNASGLTVQSSAAGVLSVLPPSSIGIFTSNKVTPTAAADWSALVLGFRTGTLPRVGTVASSATPAINTDILDQFDITALAAAITSMTTGLSGTTPVDGQRLTIRFKDNGTARAITWGAGFVASGVNALLTTTVATKTHVTQFLYDSVKSAWVCIYTDATGY